MNWFDILKDQKLQGKTQTGMAPIDIQKPFKRVKEEEDCTQKIIDEYIRLCQKFYGETPRKLDMFGSARVWYKIGDGKSLNESTSMLMIEFPETNEENKAYCAFYDKFAQGRNFYPPNPEVKQFYNNDWDKVDGKHSIYTRSERKDRDSPTSNFNYYGTLYDMTQVDYYDKIDVRFENLPEDAWT